MLLCVVDITVYRSVFFATTFFFWTLSDRFWAFFLFEELGVLDLDFLAGVFLFTEVERRGIVATSSVCVRLV
jgi:hypothetical protein